MAYMQSFLCRFSPATAAFTCLMLVHGHVFSQSFNGAQAQADLALYRARLEELEERLGRYDPQLLEVLERIAQLTVELDQFDETDAILDRAIQILRISEGLNTDSQIPFLLLSARNNVRRDEWRDANETIGYLTELYNTVPRPLNDRLVNELIQLLDLHIEGVARDQAELKDLHFRSAEDIGNFALQVAENIWAPADVRLVDIYYRIVIRNYLQFMVLVQGGPGSQSLRQFLPGMESMMRSRLEMERLYYRLGLDLYARIRSVYESAEPPDNEAVAMVDLYVADWHVIFDKGDPREDYLVAYRNLSEAGVSQEALLRFFQLPRVLPIHRFHPSVQQAQDAVSEQSLLSARNGADRQPVSRFTEWSHSMTHVQNLVEEPSLLASEVFAMDVARFAFTLDGVDRVGRWVRGRYISQVSVVDRFELLSGSNPRGLTDEELGDRLHFLNFRPVLRDGVPQRYEGTLDYHYFP